MMHECYNCNELFYSVTGLKIHKKQHLDTNEISTGIMSMSIIHCPECDVNFDTDFYPTCPNGCKK